MPLLLHLNGPSGVGKSTLARRWADDRPGTLCLDVDQLVPSISGWENGFLATWESARRLALVMAAEHLAQGHDVVLPQMLNQVEEADRFESVAAGAGASYVEVALLVPPSTQHARFRGKSRSSAVDRLVGELSDEALARIHGHHAAYLEQRPGALRLDTDGLDPDTAYSRLVGLVSGR